MYVIRDTALDNKRLETNVGLLLSQRRRLCANIKPTLGQPPMFTKRDVRRKTRNIKPMLLLNQCCFNVVDGGPTLQKYKNTRRDVRRKTRNIKPMLF